MTIDINRPMTPKQFAKWLDVSEDWVRSKLSILPGVIRESREIVRILPRAYLESRTKVRFN